LIGESPHVNDEGRGSAQTNGRNAQNGQQSHRNGLHYPFHPASIAASLVPVLVSIPIAVARKIQHPEPPRCDVEEVEEGRVDQQVEDGFGLSALYERQVLLLCANRVVQLLEDLVEIIVAGFLLGPRWVEGGGGEKHGIEFK